MKKRTSSATPDIRRSMICPPMNLKRMKMKKTKSHTDIALDYMAKHPEATPYAAAKFAGIEPSVIYRAIQARNRPRCPHCGQMMPLK